MRTITMARKNRHKIIGIIRCLAFIHIIFLYGCIDRHTGLKQALQYAGDNRIELEKVLNRYSVEPSDSLKYKAACFLIESMPGYYYYEGEALEKYANYFRLLGESKDSPAKILDSLKSEYGPFDLSDLTLKFDIKEIDSAYLCENIDLAFKVWHEKPWTKNVTFEDFCEYVLPYRTSNETLTNWRKDYLDEYGYIMDGITVDDPVEAAIILRREILKKKRPDRLTLVNPEGYPDLDAFTAKYLKGSCDNVNQFVIFLLRAFGITCAIDQMPNKGIENTAHSWVSLKNSKNEYFAIDYFGDVTYISGTEFNRSTPKPKVYRKTFSRNTKQFNRLDSKTTSIPHYFSKYNYRFFDVTGLYSNYLMDLSIPEERMYGDRPKNTKIYYLCVPSRLDWVPVDWTDKYYKGSLIFENIEAGCTFRVAAYIDNNIVFITDPFKVHEQTREIIGLGGNDKSAKKPLVLYSKYSLENENTFRERMVGGVFEAANNPAFIKPDTLHIIVDKPFRLFHHVSVFSENRYRYVRYKGGEGSFCNVAEVQFLSDSTVLQGKIIGTPGCWQNDGSHEYTNVYDGSTESSFDHNTQSEGWAGLDLGHPQKITDIIYSPRNYDNYIKKGDTYELFLCGRKDWNSLGIQIAQSDSLRFENIPMGGLYYLRNYSGGVQERPFIVEKGKAVFL